MRLLWDSSVDCCQQCLDWHGLGDLTATAIAYSGVGLNICVSIFSFDARCVYWDDTRPLKQNLRGT